MSKWGEMAPWQRRSIASLTAVGLAFTAGVKTHHIEVMDSNGNGYRQSGVRGGSVEVPLLGKTIYVSEESFKDKDLISKQGIPLHPDPALAIYKPNAVLADAAMTVQELQSLGVFCPNDAALVGYNPPPAEVSTSTVLPVDMRVCIDFGKTAAHGGGVSIPLALEKSGNLPPMQLDYTDCSAETRFMFSRYANIANDQIISMEQINGQQVALGTRYSVNIMSNAVAAGPCDSNAVQSAHP